MALKSLSSLNASSWFIAATFSLHFNHLKVMQIGQSSDQYSILLQKLKEDLKMKQMKRRHDEVYLGKNSFTNELHRSFNEFIVNVVVTLGFCPLKLR
jgi:hypothetical protein